MKLPVVLIGFNRPERIIRVLETVLQYNPSCLYISIDGPRNETDSSKVQEVRSLILSKTEGINAKIRFHEQNIGFNDNVTSAISWMFENEEAGIILEDDCLPHDFFYEYCESLLKRYEKESKIKLVSGFSYDSPIKDSEHNYYFSSVIGSWGWATWRDRWQEFSWKSNELSDNHLRSVIRKHFNHKLAVEYLKDIMKKRSWDTCFFYNILENDGCVVLPKHNLINNIGFDNNATNTNELDHPLANVQHTKLERFDLSKYPRRIQTNKKHDTRIIFEKVICNTPEKKITTYINLTKRGALRFFRLIMKPFSLIHKH